MSSSDIEHLHNTFPRPKLKIRLGSKPRIKEEDETNLNAKDQVSMEKDRNLKMNPFSTSLRGRSRRGSERVCMFRA